ncbi:MAG: fused PTS fructose transporter subunit IIA/HPr protein [Candidatus Schmidhempelia sp.]|nr:fused PTS fructose transporter subunit IIA/HPr protein [Candidatus Schmidhempelia sp.]
MFELITKDVHLNQSAPDKTQAIKNIAQALVDAGLVEDGYSEGMLQREQQAATYLDNGIAIPHGTTTTRHLVKKTGVQVFHFPQGVAWGEDGQLAYVAIGIAASSDEHLTLLRQLTRVLGEDSIEEQIKNVKTAEDMINILTGKNEINDEIFIDSSLMSVDIAVDDLQTLQILNVSRLQKANAVNSTFIANIIDHKPSYLGEGIWLDDNLDGNLKNAIVLSRPASNFLEDNKPVKLLITIASIDSAFDAIIAKLADLIFEHKLDALINSDIPSLENFFRGRADIQISSNHEQVLTQNVNSISQEFVVLNSHGLHTRPSTVLIKLIKGFNCSVTVTNLDGSKTPVNATSLMKVVALGAKKGHRLQFVATGDDAQQVLDAIGKAMSEGLGEGVE